MADNKIVIWGTGNIARKFFYEKCYQYDVQYFIDNYEPKYQMGNLKVFRPHETNLRKYKIVIAIFDWQSVSKQLEENGLKFYKDYLPYNKLEIDEIPILDILSNISMQEDQEDAVQYYTNGRKIAWIHGNCQTFSIKKFLKQNREFNKEYVFLDMPAVHIIPKDKIDLLMQNSLNILQRVKLFITQNISLNNAYDFRLSNEWLIEQMPKDVKYIRISNLFFDIYFPQAGKEQDSEKEEFIRSIFPYNDAIIDELSTKLGFQGEGGYSPNEVVQIANLDNLFTEKFMLWVIKYRMDQLKEREAACDVKMMDYVEEHYQKDQLFYSRNHPTNMILKEESIRILRTINSEWTTDIDHEETIAPLSTNQEFIYPSVARNLKLTFEKKWYSDTISECKYTMDDEIKKYLFCCHNNNYQHLP